MSDAQRKVVMEAQIEATAEAVRDIALRISRIDEMLRGNGRKGLATEHAVLQERVATLEMFAKDLRYLRQWATVGILALLGSVSWATIEWVMRMKG